VGASLTATDVRGLAPEAFAAFDIVFATADALVPDDLLTLARTQVGGALGSSDEPLASGPAAALASQFVADVASVDDDLRNAALTELGAGAFDFVQCCYVFDMTTRLRHGFTALLGADPFVPADPAPPAADSLFAALEAMFAAVARLRHLDALTTEIVRLRGARAHNCRLCRSLRNVEAARGGADETIYDQIDHYETSTLSGRHKVALHVVDAMLWSPLHYPPSLAEQVRVTFDPAETTELLLDIARNAANKIAVAFAADAPHVTEGVEYYDTDARGELVYGLTLDES
jgi:hypothetical protein